MSRVDPEGYGEDFPNQNELYRANTDRALKGKKGQAFLRELEAALLALPEKKLIPGEMVSGRGVCALGALACRRGIQDDLPFDDTDIELLAKRFGITFNLAWEAVYINDECGPSNETGEARYERVLQWVRGQIVQTAGEES